MSETGLVLEEALEKKVIRVMDEVKTIGITCKQIAHKIGEDKLKVYALLKVLKAKGEITRIGRSLWILKAYEDMNRDPQFVDPQYYTNEFEKEFHIEIARYKLKQKITFSENGARSIHRWSPYVQGFSASFVDNMLTKFGIEKGQWVLDPFVGSGTVSVCAKMRGINSIGLDLMPLMSFMAKVKTVWDLDLKEIRKGLDKTNKHWKSLSRDISIPFLKKTKKQFDHEVLNSLLTLKESIFAVEDPRIRNLFKLAFTSILIDSSNLKRSPCLGYVTNKNVNKDTPFLYFRKKIGQMLEDLSSLQGNRKQAIAEIITGDARMIAYQPESFDMAITSPPYVNGLDYVINYKIEMAWLNLVKSYKDLQKLKDKMVACDNISRVVIRNFSKESWKYCDEWLEDIISRIAKRVQEKDSYRRSDMHLIVRKYFEDVYPVFQNVYDGLKDGGRFILVIGDSLIAGVYIPADLILARIGQKVGFKVERIEIARERRSGQRRDFRLRESIVMLVKGTPSETQKRLNSFLD